MPKAPYWGWNSGVGSLNKSIGNSLIFVLGFGEVGCSALETWSPAGAVDDGANASPPSPKACQSGGPAAEGAAAGAKEEVDAWEKASSQAPLVVCPMAGDLGAVGVGGWRVKGSKLELSVVFVVGCENAGKMEVSDALESVATPRMSTLLVLVAGGGAMGILGGAAMAGDAGSIALVVC